MNVSIHPGKIDGSIRIPPSKSMAHRAILCASLASGRSMLSSIDYSDDIKATIQAMRQLGATIEKHPDHLVIDGCSPFDSTSTLPIDCVESGSTLRFLIPLFGLRPTTTTFHGRNRLLQRPQDVYQRIFLEQGLHFSMTEKELLVEGPLKPQTFRVRGDSSSQFISGLLFALPLLSADSIIEVTGSFESRSYVDLTVSMLEKFGIEITQQHTPTSICYLVRGNQSYQPTNVTVEGDYSQLAFFGVLGAINGPLDVTGVDIHSKQGDRVIVSYLRECGVAIEPLANGYRFLPSQIHGATLDLKDCPDLGPILMILGMFADTPIRLINAGRLRIKESDRIEAMAEGLRTLGVTVDTSEDEVTVHPKQFISKPSVICGYKDHRIVMSFAIAATKLDCPIVITDAESISKSFPSFFNELEHLGIEVQYD